MLELKTLRNDRQRVVDGLAKRGWKNAKEVVDSLFEMDEEKRIIQTRTNEAQAEANMFAKSIGQLMKEGKKEEAEEAKEKSSELKKEVKALEQELVDNETKMRDTLLGIPNIANEKVPFGLSEKDNLTIKEWGEIPKLHEGAKPHWELIEDYDIVDFATGSKVTGSGFPFYKGKGVRLQLGLVQFFLQEARLAGYTEYLPPLMVNEASGIGTGQLPDKEGMMYTMERDELYMIPTAEVPITNIYRDQMVEEESLPIKMAAYSPCFRREAGSWGADVRGLNRLHQFDKVEIVQIQTQEKSYEALDDMCAHVENILTALELPWRKLLLCGADLGFTSAITYDYEVYSTAQERWLEVSSVSNFETYQANRLKLRYRDKNNNKALAHTLNGSALALPRIVAALLENNQTPEGIHLPAVLHAFCGFQTIDNDNG